MGRQASGEGGIRTLGRLAPTPVFETGPIGRSGTSPGRAAVIIEAAKAHEKAAFRRFNALPAGRRSGVSLWHGFLCVVARSGDRATTWIDFDSDCRSRPLTDLPINRYRYAKQRGPPATWRSVYAEWLPIETLGHTMPL